MNHVNFRVIKTGLLNQVGNKGAVQITLNLQNTAFSFICAHLQAGDQQLKERMDQINDIHKEII